MLALDLLLIGLGGFFGAAGRDLLSKKFNPANKDKFPLGTFMVNLAACAIFGFIIGVSQGRSYSTLLFITGFTGAFSTFSTYVHEFWEISNQRRALGGLYILSSIVGGLLCYEGILAITKLLLPNGI